MYRLDVGGNACALGSAYKAVWAVERASGERFEELIGQRWREEEFVKRVADGFDPKLYAEYAKGVEALEVVEAEVLRGQKVNVGTSGAGQVG